MSHDVTRLVYGVSDLRTRDRGEGNYRGTATLQVGEVLGLLFLTIIRSSLRTQLLQLGGALRGRLLGL